MTSPRQAFQPQTSVEHVQNENSENPAKIPCPSEGLSRHKQVLQVSMNVVAIGVLMRVFVLVFVRVSV